MSGNSSSQAWVSLGYLPLPSTPLMRGRCGRCVTTLASETSPGRWAGIPRTSLDERGRTLRPRTGGEFAQGHAGSPLGWGGA